MLYVRFMVFCGECMCVHGLCVALFVAGASGRIVCCGVVVAVHCTLGVVCVFVCLDLDVNYGCMSLGFKGL